MKHIPGWRGSRPKRSRCINALPTGCGNLRDSPRRPPVRERLRELGHEIVVQEGAPGQTFFGRVGDRHRSADPYDSRRFRLCLEHGCLGGGRSQVDAEIADG